MRPQEVTGALCSALFATVFFAVVVFMLRRRDRLFLLVVHDECLTGLDGRWFLQRTGGSRFLERSRLKSETEALGKALEVSARAGHNEVVRLLVAARADTEHVDHNSGTPLHWTAMIGHAETCRSDVFHGS